MLKSLLLFSTFLVGIHTYAQSNNMGIGTTTPDASAKLDIESTEQGFLCPRMTSEQREAISNPAEGLLVYDLSDSVFWFYSGNEWKSLEVEIPNFPSDFIYSDLSQTGLANEGPTVLGTAIIPSSATNSDGGWIQIHAFGSVISDSASIIFRFQGNDLIFPIQTQGVWEANIRVYRENALSLKATGSVFVGTESITSQIIAAHNFDSDMLLQLLFTQDPPALNGINLEGFSVSRIN